MRFIASWSGGKDSTASIILAHENHEPLEEIIFCEVMFDIRHGASGENPCHIHFVKEVAKPVFESWGYKVTLLRADRDYLDLFDRIIERPTKHMENKGKKFGFPIIGRCQIQRDLKLRPMESYIRKIAEPVTQYVGIGADEPKRITTLMKNKNCVSLLEKYAYSEELAKQKCLEYGLLSPAYWFSRRGGCWFCPNARLAEQREIRWACREAWEQFVRLEDQADRIANPVFNPFKPSLHEINEWLEKEESREVVTEE